MQAFAGLDLFQESFGFEILGNAALLAVDQGILQSLHLGLVFLEQAQSSPDHVAGGAIAAGLDLFIDEACEVVAQGH